MNRLMRFVAASASRAFVEGGRFGREVEQCGAAGADVFSVFYAKGPDAHGPPWTPGDRCGRLVEAAGVERAGEPGGARRLTTAPRPERAKRVMVEAAEVEPVDLPLRKSLQARDFWC